MNELDLPIRAAVETAAAHGVPTDRCDILQNGHTLVLRLSETLVARVVTDREGPRQGSAWFARENAVACHLAGHGAPVIPMHPELPPGPHEHLGYTLNFWQYVTRVPAEPSPEDVGRTLYECHAVLRDCPEPLPDMAIITETVALLATLEERALFPQETLKLLRTHLEGPLEALAASPKQPLHGDAHEGNLMNTTLGLLWTDWEDTFQGPVEWDVASIIWNPKVLEGDEETAGRIVSAYRQAGGCVRDRATPVPHRPGGGHERVVPDSLSKSGCFPAPQAGLPLGLAQGIHALILVPADGHYASFGEMRCKLP